MTSLPSLSQIFDNKDFAAVLMFAISALVGQLWHGVKKSLEGDVSCVGWFTNNLPRTIGAAMGNIGGVAVVASSGVLGAVMAHPNGWWALCLFGFMNGLGFDSTLNKATRDVWSPEQRAA